MRARKKPHDAGAAGKKASEHQSTNHPGPSTRNSFPIVGIGASAGGLEAFTDLLKHLPADTGLGFVLVQHLDPQHESALSQLLGRVTSMPVTVMPVALKTHDWFETLVQTAMILLVPGELLA